MQHSVFKILVWVVGLSGGLISIFDLQLKSAMPQLSTPVMLQQFRGIDSWSLQQSLKLTLDNGQTLTLPIDQGFIENIGGSALQNLAYLLPSLSAPVQTTQATFSQLKLAFCNDGALARRIKLSGKVTKILLTVSRNAAPGVVLWQDSSPCD